MTGRYYYYLGRQNDVIFINDEFELIQNEIDIDSITENEWMTSSERNFKINQLDKRVWRRVNL